MKKIILILFLTCFFTSNLLSQRNIDKGSKQITTELLKKYIDRLADDSMMGRNTPSPELDKAANFIAAEFESMGIQKVNGSYFQPIPFCSKNLDIKNTYFKISSNDGIREFALKTEFTPFENTANTSIVASIVFAGYGITAPEYNYDDYKDIDVTGKVVLILKHEPGENDPNSTFAGEKSTIYSMQSTKLSNARNHGAIGVLLVTDPLNHLSLTPQGYPWPGLSKFLPQDNLPFEVCPKDELLPFVQVGENVIKYLFGSVDSLKNIQKRIDESLLPQSIQLSNTSCELSTKLIVKEYIANNVVGFLEGRSKRLKSEVVVIGGHYDHVGFMKNHREGEDYIFNGADDNASGTAGVMAVAKAFSKMNKNPKRSVLFILFAGEEKGLIGSNYYCANPLLPIDKTVAMINLDMIGRNGNDTLQIEGLKFNPDLAKILLNENQKIGLKLVAGQEDLFGRSDHYEFFKKNITAVDITSGLHSDYHTVRDNPNTINHLKAALISQLTFRTAWVISNQKSHYKILKRN